MLLTLLMSSFTVNAQSWSDCVSWFRGNGKAILAGMAHATYDVNDYVIKETSPDIILKVYYKGHFIDFSCTYRVVQGKYNGTPLVSLKKN